MGGDKPHPLDAGQGVDGRQGIRQAMAIEVEPVGIDDLADEDDLTRPLVDELPRLGDDFIQRTTALRAASKRHDAVGAALVAAVDDVDITRDRPFSGQRRGLDVFVRVRAGNLPRHAREHRLDIQRVEQHVYGPQMRLELGSIRVHRASR